MARGGGDNGNGEKEAVARGGGDGENGDSEKERMKVRTNDSVNLPTLSSISYL